MSHAGRVTIPIECNVWLSLELTGPEGRQGLRKDMVNAALDTLSDEVQFDVTE